jgi:hypothetical protein
MSVAMQDKPKRPAKVKKTGAVKVAKFEIVAVENGDYRERTAAWRSLAAECQNIANCFHDEWKAWHRANGSRAKIFEYLAAVKAWRDAEQAGEKPKLDLKCITKEADNAFYRAVTDQCPLVNARTRILLLNILKGKLGSRKASVGTMSGWISILLNRESMPSFNRPIPIPFDKVNAKIIRPKSSDENWQVELRVDRIEPAAGKSVASSTPDLCRLMTKGRKVAGQVAILHRIASGEYEFCGSSLQFMQSRNKWFALICYRMPEVKHPEADVKRMAILRPGYFKPWFLRYDGRSRWRGGPGSLVESVRRQLLTQRWSRQANYRYAGSSNKGHGRKRALLPIEKLSQRWKDFVKTMNHQVTSAVVQELLQSGIGTLVYIQPDDRMKAHRILAKAGKVPNREDATGWDWFQVKSMLEYKCKEHGIHLIAKKGGYRAAKDGEFHFFPKSVVSDDVKPKRKRTK